MRMYPFLKPESISDNDWVSLSRIVSDIERGYDISFICSKYKKPFNSDFVIAVTHILEAFSNRDRLKEIYGEQKRYSETELERTIKEVSKEITEEIIDTIPKGQGVTVTP